jgi:hypothetical protein
MGVIFARFLIWSCEQTVAEQTSHATMASDENWDRFSGEFPLQVLPYIVFGRNMVLFGQFLECAAFLVRCNTFSQGYRWRYWFRSAWA